MNEAVAPYTLDVTRWEDPYPYLAALRSADPVHYSTAADIWVLTRFDDVKAAFGDWKTWSSERRGNLLNDMPERLGRTLGTTDPPRHSSARRLVNMAFTNRTVATLEPAIKELSAELHDIAGAKGTFEYVHEISAPLNARVLGSMFGVPDSDFMSLRHWLDDFFVRDEPEPGKEPRQAVAMANLRAYIFELVEARQAEPGPDLVSAMLAAKEGAEALSLEQVAFTTMTFLTAGFESTNNLFTNMTLALSQHPHLLPRLKADPAAREAFVEEAMRYDAAAQGFVRCPTTDVDLRGRTIPEGAQVLLHIGAANRDPDAFPNPDTFDIDRSSNRHLGLGHGQHFCVGAPLGRVLTQVALADLVERTTELSVDLSESIRVLTPNFRGFQRLSVSVG